MPKGQRTGRGARAALAGFVLTGGAATAAADEAEHTCDLAQARGQTAAPAPGDNDVLALPKQAWKRKSGLGTLAGRPKKVDGRPGEGYKGRP